MGLVPVSLAKSLINKYLNDSSMTKAVTYKSLTKSYDPSTAEVTETVQSIAIRALVIEYTDWKKKSSNGAVKRGDQRLLIREKDFTDEGVTPKIGDRITIDSINWEIVQDGINRIVIDSTIVMYEFHCRS